MITSLKSQIFDPYFTPKETGKGTGMGLSIGQERVLFVVDEEMLGEMGKDMLERLVAIM